MFKLARSRPFAAALKVAKVSSPNPDVIQIGALWLTRQSMIRLSEPLMSSRNASFPFMNTYLQAC